MYSILMPLLNKAPHLERAVRSVLSQKGAAFELIVVDDGSDDGSLEIAEGLARLDDRIRLLRRSTPGPGGYAARNLGAREARGEWLGFLDADDEWKPGFLCEIDRLRALFPSAGFISAAYEVVEASGAVRAGRFAGRMADRAGGAVARLLDPADFAAAARKGRWPAHTSSSFVRRDALLDIGGFPEGRCSRGGDRDTWLRLLVAVPYAWTPFVGAAYRTDSVNMVTRSAPRSAEPCILSTIRGVLDRRGTGTPSPRLRRELIRLHDGILIAHCERLGKSGGAAPIDPRRFLRPFDLVLAARILLLAFLTQKTDGANP